jgi:hypothetical protein
MFPALEKMLKNYGAVVNMLADHVQEKIGNWQKAQKLYKQLLDFDIFLGFRFLHGLANDLYKLSLIHQQSGITFEPAMKAVEVRQTPRNTTLPAFASLVSNITIQHQVKHFASPQLRYDQFFYIHSHSKTFTDPER